MSVACERRELINSMLKENQYDGNQVDKVASGPIEHHPTVRAPEATDDRLDQPLLPPHLLEDDIESIAIDAAWRSHWRGSTGRGSGCAGGAWDDTGVCLDEFFEDGGCRAADVDERGGRRENADDGVYEVGREGGPAVVEFHEVLHCGEGVLRDFERRVESRDGERTARVLP